MKSVSGEGETMFKVFVRNWWRYAGKGESGTPGGILGLPTPREVVADPRARKHTLATQIRTEDEARAIAREYNRTHKPGPLSRKAEYDET